MKKRVWMALCLQVCLLAACTRETTDPVAERHDDFLEVVFSTIETRTDLDENGSGTFSEGDKVGLFIDNGSTIEYRELTCTGGQWLPQLKRSEFGDGTLTLSAHYPAQTEADPTHAAFTLTDDQSSDGFAASDLLFARQSVPAGSNRAEMTFAHALHRLRIQINGESVSTPSLRSRMNGSVDLLTGAVSVADDSFGWITPRTNGDGAYEAVIFPQTVDTYRDEEGLLKIPTAVREIVYKAPDQLNGEPLTEFEAGKQLTIRLTVKKDDIEPGTPDLANKTLWVYGLDVPDFPGEENIPTYTIYQTVPDGIWFRLNLDIAEDQSLTWTDGCGWYDCNKSRNYDEGDRNLCWAASSSNLLIWWMVNNWDYIQAYDAEYYKDKNPSVTSTATGRVFDRPAPDFKPLYAPDGSVNRAPVFEFFKALSDDRSGWNTAGVNWFITGKSSNVPVTNKNKGFPGFFSEIFQQTDEVAKDSNRFPTREHFNAFVTEALLNKRALGFSVVDIAGAGTGSHAMTLWGVKYDENGVISEAYYCDNNNSDQDRNGAVITRYTIVYDDTQTYLQKLPPKDGGAYGKFAIQCVSAVDLRQDIWAAKYPSVNPAR